MESEFDVFIELARRNLKIERADVWKVHAGRYAHPIQHFSPRVAETIGKVEMSLDFLEYYCGKDTERITIEFQEKNGTTLGGDS